MKKSELLETIEEIITEILSEGTKTFVATSGNDEEQAIQQDNTIKNKQAVIKTIKGSSPGTAVVAATTTNESDDDEFDTLDDIASDKESNKSAKEEEKKNKKANKKRDEIISAYKKIAGDIKAKAKAANSGDKEAKAWILKHQDTIKAYNKLKN